MLVGAMQLIKSDGKNPDPAHQVMFLEQLDSAELLAPADVKAEVGPDGEKLMDKKHTVRFPVLTGADGRRFFVVFTDNAALEKARKLEGASKLPEEFVSEAVTVKLADLAKFVLTPGPDGSENTTYGIVINPFTEIPLNFEISSIISAAASGFTPDLLSSPPIFTSRSTSVRTPAASESLLISEARRTLSTDSIIQTFPAIYFTLLV